MKTLLLCIVVLLGSNYIYSQVAKVQFADNTIGYAVDIHKRLGVGDTIVLESLDQKVWIPVTHRNPQSVIKTGTVQKIVFYTAEFEDIYANFYFADDNRKKPRIESVDDWTVVLFNVGDTIQVVGTINEYGDETYKLHFGQLPNVNTPEK